MSEKRWCVMFLEMFLALMILFGGIVLLIDPFFHYHEPLEMFSYPIDDARYQNDGISKHFDYDAIITGSSMTQNFKTSEFEEMFNKQAIKVAYPAGTHKEVNDNLLGAIEANPKIQIVIRSLDYTHLFHDKEYVYYKEDFYPWYLYDDNYINDVEYLFNKDVLLKNTVRVFEYTLGGKRTTTFDEYGNWMKVYEFGEKAVRNGYHRKEKAPFEESMTDEDYLTLYENHMNNVIQVIVANPQIEFYLFFPPFSIYYWDDANQKGELRKVLQGEKAVIELLVEYSNVHLFAFLDEYEMICNLENYKDITHYSEDINSQILVWMKEGTHQLTKDNYMDYCTRVNDFYTNYNYDKLFE